MSSAIVSQEGPILRRVFRPEEGDLPEQAAEWLLGIRLEAGDQERIAVLYEKAREGILTPEEDAELEDYGNVMRMLELMKIKAKASLKEGKRTV